jgi:hypothetical protein
MPIRLNQSIRSLTTHRPVCVRDMPGRDLTSHAARSLGHSEARRECGLFVTVSTHKPRVASPAASDRPTPLVTCQMYNTLYKTSKCHVFCARRPESYNNFKVQSRYDSDESLFTIGISSRALIQVSAHFALQSVIQAYAQVRSRAGILGDCGVSAQGHPGRSRLWHSCRGTGGAASCGMDRLLGSQKKSHQTPEKHMSIFRTLRRLLYSLFLFPTDNFVIDQLLQRCLVEGPENSQLSILTSCRLQLPLLPIRSRSICVIACASSQKTLLPRLRRTAPTIRHQTSRSQRQKTGGLFG